MLEFSGLAERVSPYAMRREERSAVAVDVLLPTYNGAEYLPIQLESVRQQQEVAVFILARDDASVDTTPGILRDFSRRYGRIQISRGERLGVTGNIDALLVESETRGAASYFALADQDDIWYPRKLRAQLEVMKTLEARYGREAPLLVCSDARCVDARGRELYPSFLDLLGIPDDWCEDLRNVLVMSCVLGCSIFGNAALRRAALPLPPGEGIFMHDWWLLLTAVCFGAAYCIRQPLLDYRQHPGNTVAARGGGGLAERARRSRESARRTQRQAGTFLRHFQHQLTPGQRAVITDWASMPEKPHIARLWRCLRKGFGKPGLRWFVT